MNSEPRVTGLDAIMRPRSVAVVGVSRQPGSLGAEILRNLILGGFQGAVYPVNRHSSVVHSLRSYPSVTAIPDEIDLAVLVVPRDTIMDTIDECAEKGVRGLVVITAGFREVGSDGLALEQTLRDKAKAAGIRLVGPNCMGVINTAPDVSLNASFASTQPTRGRVAFLSQSGALGEAIISHAREIGVGLSQFVSVGNKVDVSGNDLLEYWEDDPETDFILMYLESFGNPRHFTSIARRVTRKKPIVAVKSGRTAAGARAAQSHTGSLAGSEIATDALLDQCGVLRVATINELFDVAKGFSAQPLPRGRRVAVVTNAGGPGILTADACEAAGLELPEFTTETTEKLRSKLSSSASVANPVDMIASAGAEEYAHTVRTVLDDPGADALIVLSVPPATQDTGEVAREVIEATQGTDRPVLACFMGLDQEGGAGSLLQKAGIPCYMFPESAVRTLEAMAHYRGMRDRPEGNIKHFDVNHDCAKKLVERARKEGRARLTLDESFELLRCYGLPVAPCRSVSSRETAIDAGRELGYPVVLKNSSESLEHKTEAGGVALGIKSTDDLIAAYERMADGGADRFLIQPQLKGGREVVLGLTVVPNFGPLLMFGLGGVYVEVMRDVTFKVNPLTDNDAHEMVRSIRGLPLLTGFRGEPAVDLGIIEECLLRLSQLAHEVHEVAELDINPLVVFPDRKRTAVVDARVVITTD